MEPYWCGNCQDYFDVDHHDENDQHKTGMEYGWIGIISWKADQYDKVPAPPGSIKFRDDGPQYPEGGMHSVTVFLGTDADHLKRAGTLDVRLNELAFLKSLSR